MTTLQHLPEAYHNSMEAASLRLEHGWSLRAETEAAPELIDEFIRPAVRAVPRALAARLGSCRIRVVARLEDATGGELSSQWTEGESGLEITVAFEGSTHHDVAMELLVCLGQALWEKTSGAEREAYWKLLAAEIEAGVSGEIDEDAFEEKKVLLGSRTSARSPRRFQRYARVSFSGTVAEYVHCMWHDVEIRSGSEHLPAPWLRQRLEMLARWFPPDPGHPLFGAVRQSSG